MNAIFQKTARRLDKAARAWRPYDDASKREFKNAALAFLRDLRSRLLIESKDADIRWNAGGIAVSGDATLHGERLYVHVSIPFYNGVGSGWFYARACAGRKDYGTSMAPLYRNRWCHPFDAETICREILKENVS